MKNAIISRLALMLPVFLGFAMTAGATSLTMTEVSSTTLTYSLNGGAVQTVIATTPDHWSFFLAGTEVVTGLGGVQNVNVNWKEPDYATSGLVNYVNFYQYDGNGTTMTVASDVAPQGYPLENN